ncbi:Spo11/DNA topoisomerase VI subunit A [Chytriomyces sp. MP71]|nr:Spo11/DNA topoisomerase VI subunit A [Chytriomyces sp. MP71]
MDAEIADFSSSESDSSSLRTSSDSDAESSEGNSSRDSDESLENALLQHPVHAPKAIPHLRNLHNNLCTSMRAIAALSVDGPRAMPPVTVTLGGAHMTNKKMGDQISISNQLASPVQLANELDAICKRVEAIRIALASPVLNLVARDDRVWRYNHATNKTILDCDPKHIWTRIKGTSPKFDQIIKILEIVRDLLRQGKTATKRDIYYRHVNLFKTQSSVDEIIEMISCSLGVQRHLLNVIASPKGLIIGPLRLHVLNCNTGKTSIVSCAESAVLIPPVHSIVAIEYFGTNNILKLLVIEKEASFNGIAGEIRALSRSNSSAFNWILITGKGYPDRNTHSFVHLLARIAFPVSRIWTRPTFPPESESACSVPDDDADHMSLFSSDEDEDEDEADWMDLSSHLGTPPRLQWDMSAKDILRVQLYGLFDADPHGIDIALVYMFGGTKNAFEAPRVAVPDLRWVGVMASDVLTTHRERLFGLDGDAGVAMRMDKRERVKLLAVLGRVRGLLRCGDCGGKLKRIRQVT